MPRLLDPKNDLVFKKLFVECPDLLADLINAVRSDEAPVEIIGILNPRIDPKDITGKFIVLDVLARDSDGLLFNVEMQVRSLTEWVERSLYYVASAYANQLKQGDNYDTLKPVIGISLLDFDLFKGRQAHWHFKLRDGTQSTVELDPLQLHMLELRKLDRQRAELTGTLRDWILWFRHWHEDGIMNDIRHPPIHKASEQLQRLSNDEETRWQALVRRRAILDEASFMASARREGVQEGIEQGIEQGIQIGEGQGQVKALARQLTLKFGDLPDALRQRLEQADTTTLDLWLDRVLFAPTLEDVFR